jgi:hypothetical protein
VRRAVIQSAIVISVIAGIVGLVYLILLWRDELPNADARKLQNLYERRVAIPDPENAWIDAYGFSAPADQQAHEHGLRRVEWMRHRRESRKNPGDDPGKDNPRMSVQQTKVLERIAEKCNDSTATACLAALDQAGTEPLTKDETVLLVRYEALTRREGWYESMVTRADEPFAEFAHIVAAQRVFLIRLRQSAQRGETAQVREALERDLAFARRLLEQADGLITKMIAVVLIRQNFLYGSYVLRELPPDQVMASVPPGWTTPFSPAELSMWRCMASEYMFARQEIREKYQGIEGLEDSNLAERIFVGLRRSRAPTMELNAWSRTLAATAESFSVPLREYPRAQRALMERQDLERSSDMALYAWRVGSVEGMRRLALFVARMRGQSVSLKEVPDRVRQAELRTPFEELPFIWLPDERTLEFEGPARRRSGLALVY